MSATITVRGAVFRTIAPRRRRTGESFWILTVRDAPPNGAKATIWTVFAWQDDEVRAALSDLKEGDRVEISGPLRVTARPTATGEIVLEYSVSAKACNGIARPKKLRKSAKKQRDGQGSDKSPAAPCFNDPVEF